MCQIIMPSSLSCSLVGEKLSLIANLAGAEPIVYADLRGMDAVQLMGEAILPRRHQRRDAGGASAGHFVVQADEHVLSLDAPVVGERPFEAAAERPYVREVLNGIFYILWTGCQWKALRRRRARCTTTWNCRASLKSWVV